MRPFLPPLRIALRVSLVAIASIGMLAAGGTTAVAFASTMYVAAYYQGQSELGSGARPYIKMALIINISLLALGMGAAVLSSSTSILPLALLSAAVIGSGVVWANAYRGIQEDVHAIRHQSILPARS